MSDSIHHECGIALVRLIEKGDLDIVQFRQDDLHAAASKVGLEFLLEGRELVLHFSRFGR